MVIGNAVPERTEGTLSNLLRSGDAQPGQAINVSDRTSSSNSRSHRSQRYSKIGIDPNPLPTHRFQTQGATALPITGKHLEGRPRQVTPSKQIPPSLPGSPPSICNHLCHGYPIG